MHSATGYLAILLILVIATGCDLVGAKNDLTFKSDREAYEAGEAVEVEVQNELRSEVGMNLCFVYLELETQTSDNNWVPTGAYGGDIPDLACTAILYRGSPGRSLSGVFHLPQNQPAGTYRFSTDLEVNNEFVRAQTNTFVIR